MTEETLIQFPCDFPVKIMGFNTNNFFEDIKKITLSHFPDTPEQKIVSKPSKGNMYLGITVTVHVKDKVSLDNFYKAVTKHPHIKMVL